MDDLNRFERALVTVNGWFDYVKDATAFLYHPDSLYNIMIGSSVGALSCFLQIKSLHTRFKAVTIGVFVGCVYLSNYVEEHEGWNGFTVGFYLCCVLFAAASMKLFRKKDFFGTADGFMAITLMLFVNYAKKQLFWWQSTIFLLSAFFVLLFKLSKPAPVRANAEEGEIMLATLA